jgi:hypothetical protein
MVIHRFDPTWVGTRLTALSPVLSAAWSALLLTATPYPDRQQGCRNGFFIPMLQSCQHSQPDRGDFSGRK